MTTAPGAGVDSAAPAVADSAAEGSYTVPAIDYFQRHSEYSSAVGNNNFDFRRVSADLGEDDALQDGREEIEPPGELIQDPAAEEQAE
jgi:hypothetical protein